MNTSRPKGGGNGEEVLHLSQLCKGAYGPDEKHYPTQQDLLLVASSFIWLKTQLVAKLRFVCHGQSLVMGAHPSAPWLFLCRSEASPAHIQKFSSSPSVCWASAKYTCCFCKWPFVEVINHYNVNLSQGSSRLPVPSC